MTDDTLRSFLERVSELSEGKHPLAEIAKELLARLDPSPHAYTGMKVFAATTVTAKGCGERMTLMLDGLPQTSSEEDLIGATILISDRQSSTNGSLLEHSVNVKTNVKTD